MAEGIRQEAFAALAHLEQSRIQVQTQDRAVAETAVNRIRSEAQGVINEALGAVHRERQERSQMANAEQKAKQAEQKAKQIIKEKKMQDEMRNEKTQEHLKGQSQKLKVVLRLKSHRPRN